MSDLRSFQLTLAKVLTGLGIVHVPVLAVICAVLGRDVVANSIACAALSVIPIALTYAARSITTIAFGIAITLVGQTSLLVLAFSGHPWQVEMHFYYFAVLAMLSGFCDWRVLALAAGLVSLHHLSLNFILPDAIYPGGNNPWRVSVHAVVVVIEVAILMFIGHTIREAFATAAQARQRAEAAAAEAPFMQQVKIAPAPTSRREPQPGDESKQQDKYRQSNPVQLLHGDPLDFLFFYGEIDHGREYGADDHPEQLEPVKERDAEQVGLGLVIERRPESDGKLDNEKQVPPAPTTAFFFCGIHREAASFLCLGARSYAPRRGHVEKDALRKAVHGR